MLMKFFSLTAVLSLLPLVGVQAGEPAQYQSFFNNSLFPLQDQVRFFNREFEIPQNKCAQDGAWAIFNLQENDGKLDYECAGFHNDSCGSGCFAGEIYLGQYKPEIPCDGQLIEDGHKEIEGEGTSELRVFFVLEKQSCLDAKGKIIWQRNIGDKYVYNKDGNLIFYQGENSAISYKQHAVLREIIMTPDEIKLYDRDNPQDWIHVKYERDDQERIIRETHFNRDNFPYSMYEAVYSDDGVSINKIDGYSGRKNTFVFKNPEPEIGAAAE